MKKENIFGGTLIAGLLTVSPVLIPFGLIGIAVVLPFAAVGGILVGITAGSHKLYKKTQRSNRHEKHYPYEDDWPTGAIHPSHVMMSKTLCALEKKINQSIQPEPTSKLFILYDHIELDEINKLLLENTKNCYAYHKTYLYKLISNEWCSISGFTDLQSLKKKFHIRSKGNSNLKIREVTLTKEAEDFIQQIERKHAKPLSKETAEQPGQSFEMQHDYPTMRMSRGG